MENTKSAKVKILVVDDEPSVAEVCRRALTSKGYDVDVAANGKIAQSLIDQNRYGALLIDIRIPLMNGKELYAWLTEAHPDLVPGVVFSTGDILSGDTRGFLEQSGRFSLAKPFTLDELEDIVAKALALSVS